MSNKVTILPNKKKDPESKYTKAMYEYFGNHGCDVSFNEIFPDTSLAVVLGGDGSILRCAKNASEHKVPILGINLGRVGYMAEVEVCELDEIEKWFSGDYRIEKRMMLDIEIVRDGVVTKKMLSLNDAVFSNGAVSRMVEIDLSCNGMRAGRYRADGLIVATPTGSTAYSLSAGGPVIDPTLDCLCVTPVSAHSLGARPMIYSPDSVLEVNDSTTKENELYLTVDGNENVVLTPGDTVKIYKSDNITRLVRIKNNNFYKTFIEKMSENDF